MTNIKLIKIIVLISFVVPNSVFAEDRFGTLALSSIVSADDRFGTELSVLPNSSFRSLSYTYDAAGLSWGLTVETSPKISSTDLRNRGYVWSAFNVKTNKYLFNWQFIPENFVFDVSLGSVSEIYALLPVQKNVLIVIAQANGTPVMYFDLGKYCSQYPAKVSNQTNPTMAACEVGKLPDRAAACKEFGDVLENRVKNKLIMCDTAEKQYAKGRNDYTGAANCGIRKFCPKN